MSANPNNLFATQANSQFSQPPANPGVQNMQQGFQEAMEFQHWVSEQSQVLGRLKIFHTMAKSINDQQ